MRGPPDRPEGPGAPGWIAAPLAPRQVTLVLVAVAAAGALLQLALCLHPRFAPEEARYHPHRHLAWQPPPLPLPGNGTTAALRRGAPDGLYSRHGRPDDIFGPAPPALPAAEDHRMDEIRNEQFDFGGGQGDPPHLGGFDRFDQYSLSPAVWRWMMGTLGVRSVLDVGCGRGWSTAWFLHQGLDARCVEGSHDAVSQSAISNPRYLVEHDFARGPWWPDQTYDAAWATEFVHQVPLHHAPNYLPALRKAALLFVTAPQEEGWWHGVEMHEPQFWIRRFETLGWTYDAALSIEAQRLAEEESWNEEFSPIGTDISADLVAEHMMVFVNPAIAQLPQHAHLFPELGCISGRDGRNDTLIRRECNSSNGLREERPLHTSFLPRPAKESNEKRWKRRVQKLFSVRRPPLPRGGRNRTSATDDGFRQDEDFSMVELPPIDVNLDMSSFAVEQIPFEVKRGNTSALPKIPVLVWPMMDIGLNTAESRSILYDGLQESPWLEISTDLFNFDPNVVWLGDIGYDSDLNASCSRLNELVIQAKQKRATLELPLQWPVFLISFSDVPVIQKCTEVEESLGPKLVRYGMRSIVRGREWSRRSGWVKPGFRQNMTLMGSLIQHTPLIVRTDTITALDQALKRRQLQLSSPIEKLPRKYDIAHFWPNIMTEADKAGIGDVQSTLRTKVSKIIARMASNDTYKVHGRSLNVYVRLAGRAALAGRRSVANAYIDCMLSTKIIVITQRDKWEDHYRLFEGLVSGAMVMCDRMLSLPAGLRNGTHLVEFTGEDDLIQKALYYLEHDDERLAIAFEGRRLAMARHRSWHRMEEIVFGEPLTVCRESSGSSCPYIVHANKTWRR